jgi:hypothetical protein
MLNIGVCSLAVSNCVFEANAGVGGGMYIIGGSLNITQCVFDSNTGPAVDAWYSTVDLVNSLARDHWGDRTIMAYDGKLDVVNCTICYNLVGLAFWGLSVQGKAMNCIVRDCGTEIDTYPGVACTVTYSNVSDGHAGEGNIDADPLFESGGCTLQPSSPCVDAGISVGAPDRDLDGNPRPAGAGVDMGCYEWQP